MTLPPDTKLAQYEVHTFIGSGGMGEVYKAKDLKLGRPVAIKVLHKELATDPERLKRFEQEARAASALDHPNIVTIHDISEVDGLHFIVMQFVDGKTLRELIAGGRLSLSQVLHIAIQIADGLAKAHSAGIAHRDLKPDNIMVTEDGLVIIVDFGLAKLIEVADLSEASTKDMGQPHTKEGHIVGTAPYMSPEQAQGLKVDTRSDIFSFGSVLYETVTGRRAFSEDTLPGLLAAIIRGEPKKVSEIKPEVPHLVERVITRALRKEPSRRFQSMADIKVELQEIKEEVDSGTVVSAVRAPRHESRKRGKSLWTAGVAVVLAVLAASGVYLLLPEKETLPGLTNPIQVTSAIGVEDYPTWSPEGGRLAFMSDQDGDWDIWVTQVSGGEAVNRTSNPSFEDMFPSWSPDGSRIAFGKRSEGYSIMSALGGTSSMVSPISVLPSVTGWPSKPQWSSDGMKLACVSLAADGPSVEIVTLETRESQRFRLPGKEVYRFDLNWSLDGRYFAYVDAADRSAELTQLWVLRTSDGEGFALSDGRTNVWSPSWSADGRTLYYVSNRGGSMDLWQQSIDDGVLRGEPQRLTMGVGMLRAAFSPDFTKLAYSKGRRVANVWRVPVFPDRPATWADAQQVTFDQAFIQYLDLSPDGNHLAVSSDRSGNQDIWVLPAEGGEMKQLTTELTPDWNPSWSPDAKEIAFYAARGGNRDIWVMAADGGHPRQLTSHEAGDYHPAWSPDGSEIAFVSTRTGNFDVWIVPIEGGEPRQLTDDAGSDNFPHWSPDGNWLVFRSNLGGEPRLWRVPAAGGPSELLSNVPANRPRWLSDGQHIYFHGYREQRGTVWMLSLEDGSERPMTALTGHPSDLGGIALATDGNYIYFTWENNLGDLWVMDVVRE